MLIFYVSYVDIYGEILLYKTVDTLSKVIEKDDFCTESSVYGVMRLEFAGFGNENTEPTTGWMLQQGRPYKQGEAYHVSYTFRRP